MKTRNFLLLAFTFIFSNNICTAQFHLGAKAGANMTKLDGQAFDDSFELGYQLGGFVSYDVLPNLSVCRQRFFLIRPIPQ